MLLTETWLSDEDETIIKEITPPGYVYFNAPRQGGRGGGVGAICKSQLRQVPLSKAYDTLECCIITNKCRSMNFIVVYRPRPSRQNGLKTSEFLVDLDDFIDELEHLPGKLLLLGDLNVHFDCPTRSDIIHIKHSLQSTGLRQYVTKATHKQGHILDVVIAREDDNLITSLSIDPDLLSDHAAISCKINCDKPPPQQKVRQYRKFARIDQLSLAQDLSSKLEGPCDSKDLNEIIQVFDKVLVSVLDAHAPACESNKTVRHKPKWYNADVQQAKREQRRQERKLRKSLKSNPDCDRKRYMEAKLHMANTLLEAKVS